MEKESTSSDTESTESDDRNFIGRDVKESGNNRGSNEFAGEVMSEVINNLKFPVSLKDHKFLGGGLKKDIRSTADNEEQNLHTKNSVLVLKDADTKKILVKKENKIENLAGLVITGTSKCPLTFKKSIHLEISANNGIDESPFSSCVNIHEQSTNVNDAYVNKNNINSNTFRVTENAETSASVEQKDKNLSDAVAATSNYNKKMEVEETDHYEVSCEVVTNILKTILNKCNKKIDEIEKDREHSESSCFTNGVRDTDSIVNLGDLGGNRENTIIEGQLPGLIDDPGKIYVEFESKNEVMLNSTEPTIDPEEGVAESSQSSKEIELAHASREVLFDSESQVDLLEEYQLPNDTEEPSASISDHMINQQHNVIVIGVNMNSELHDVEFYNTLALPAHADPFPNWLLHLLGADVEEIVDPHDEPHFYCQGDGLGVHPSVIEVDIEEEHSSSDTSSSNSNDNAEAEHTVSEPEVANLPEDSENNDATEEILEVVDHIADVENVGSQVSPQVGTSNNPDNAEEFYDSVDEPSTAS